MPDINGVSFVKKIREFNNDVKIIMISMYTDKNIVQRMFKKWSRWIFIKKLFN